MNVRSYEGIQDLYAMLDLLSEGRKADNGTHYVHRGDLQWWLFYADDTQEIWRSHIQLWEEQDCLIGWALLSPEERAFDVYPAPHLRGTAREVEMLAWAVEQMYTLDHMQTIWVAENDDVRIRWLEENGFTREREHFIQFKRTLSGALDGSPLPEGFSIRTSRGEEDARLRSTCSYAAFGSTKPFEDYWPRTLRFMRSPVYVPAHELFVIAPGGEIASYCIIWTDPLTGVGHSSLWAHILTFSVKAWGRVCSSKPYTGSKQKACRKPISAQITTIRRRSVFMKLLAFNKINACLHT